MNKISIAIDGPSGAGKSTLARMIAKEFDYIYVDTGALYRCIGLYALRCGIDTKNSETVASVLKNITVEMRHDDDGLQRMYLNGDDVTDEIRQPDVSIAASNVSAIPAVRAFLLDTQRLMAERYDVVMDGRDIGTVVLPNADVKIFLTASVVARAQRRYLELCAKNIDTTYEAVLSDMIIRDHNDSSRSLAPLKPAEDSVKLDTTEYDLEESFEKMKDLIGECLNNGH